MPKRELLTNIDIVKICSLHGELTEAQAIKRINYKEHGKDFYWKCKECEHKRNHEQYIKHQEKKKAYGKAYHAAHREERNLKKKEWRINNTERNRRTKQEWAAVKQEVVKAHNKKQTENMTDAYIRSLLARTSKNLNNSDVNLPILIEIKRTALIIKRKLKAELEQNASK